MSYLHRWKSTESIRMSKIGRSINDLRTCLGVFFLSLSLYTVNISWWIWVVELAPELFWKRKKKPIGRAVATNEKVRPMRILRVRKWKSRRREKENKRYRMNVYVHIELVTSSGKCLSPFFFLTFNVCVKANLKVMILLITVRDHSVEVFAWIETSFTLLMLKIFQ